MRVGSGFGDAVMLLFLLAPYAHFNTNPIIMTIHTMRARLMDALVEKEAEPRLDYLKGEKSRIFFFPSFHWSKQTLQQRVFRY